VLRRIWKSTKFRTKKAIAEITRPIRKSLAQHRIATTEQHQLAEREKWIDTYGSFTTPEMLTEQAILGLDKESGWIRAEIVQFVNAIAAHQPVVPMLLPGEYNRVVPAYTEWLGVEAKDITTAGLGADDDVDARWNFDEDPPDMLRNRPFALILSQAMIEHLVDPYKHVSDCYGLLAPNGRLVIHTVTPGYHYHRVPVDCQRFFPDWFEEVAKRLGATVEARFVGEYRIMYQFQKASTTVGP
jgi:SAM-dependent methyltransferase